MLAKSAFSIFFDWGPDFYSPGGRILRSERKMTRQLKSWRFVEKNEHQQPMHNARCRLFQQVPSQHHKQDLYSSI